MINLSRNYTWRLFNFKQPLTYNNKIWEKVDVRYIKKNSYAMEFIPLSWLITF
jgi:hypothetical protein